MGNLKTDIILQPECGQVFQHMAEHEQIAQDESGVDAAEEERSPAVIHPGAGDL